MPRFLMLVRTDENNTPPGGPSEGLMERMGALLEEMTKGGHMLDTGGLQPTAQGARVGRDGSRTTVTDGPFTETKEVIGGYALLQARDLDQAIELARRFVEIHEPEWDIVTEVRQIVEP